MKTTFFDVSTYCLSVDYLCIIYIYICFEHSGDITCSLLVNPSHTDESWEGGNTCMWINIYVYIYIYIYIYIYVYIKFLESFYVISMVGWNYRVLVYKIVRPSVNENSCFITKLFITYWIFFSIPDYKAIKKLNIKTRQTRHKTCIRHAVLVNMPIKNVPGKNNPGITPESFPVSYAFFLGKRKY